MFTLQSVHPFEATVCQCHDIGLYKNCYVTHKAARHRLCLKLLLHRVVLYEMILFLSSTKKQKKKLLYSSSRNMTLLTCFVFDPINSSFSRSTSHSWTVASNHCSSCCPGKPPHSAPVAPELCHARLYS